MGRTNARSRSALSRCGAAFALALLLIACDQSLEIGAKLTPAPGSAGSAGWSGAPAMNAPDASNDSGAGQAGDNGPSSGGQAGTASTDPGLVWSSGFETSDLSDWSADGAVVGGTRESAATAQVSTEQSHGGSSSVKVSFDTTDGQDHLAELYRRVEPGPAYYGAWFFIAEPHTPAVYWSLFYFFAEAKAGDATTRHALWDLNLNSTAVYFYDEPLKHFVDSMPKIPYSVGRWFHLEAFLERPTPSSGHISVWLDGQPIIDVNGLTVAATDTLYWAVGSESNSLTPATCSLYVDDATISARRVGP